MLGYQGELQECCLLQGGQLALPTARPGGHGCRGGQGTGTSALWPGQIWGVGGWLSHKLAWPGARVLGQDLQCLPAQMPQQNGAIPSATPPFDSAPCSLLQPGSRGISPQGVAWALSLLPGTPKQLVPLVLPQVSLSKLRGEKSCTAEAASNPSKLTPPKLFGPQGAVSCQHLPGPPRPCATWKSQRAPCRCGELVHQLQVTPRSLLGHQTTAGEPGTCTDMDNAL